MHLPESFVRPESLSEIMTTDLCWWGVLIRNSLGASWKCTLRPPAPKCTLFKDFLSIKIFLDMLSLLKAWPLMDEVAVTMLWFDFINIFRIHNQLKCHMIHSFLEKISWRQWLLWLLWQTRQGGCCWPLIGQQWSRDLYTGLWLVTGLMSCPCDQQRLLIRGHYHDQAPAAQGRIFWSLEATTANVAM